MLNLKNCIGHYNTTDGMQQDILLGNILMKKGFLHGHNLKESYQVCN